MSMTNVIRLHDYRGRKEKRLRRTLALYRADPVRGRIAGHLWEVLELVGGDRAATVWIDEYGPGLVHVHCLLDLASDEPRRNFSMDLLRRAWEDGVPGLLDRPDLGGEDRILPGHPRSAAGVALGSDGVRAWFLVVDSRTPRPPLAGPLADSFMFLAGECTSFLLHRDLETPRPGPESTDDFERARQERFTGWPVLQDVPSGKQDREADARITSRFLVTRILRGLVDDDLSVDRESLLHQVRGARREVEKAPSEDVEARCWARVLDALEADDHRELAAATLKFGHRVERQGHFHGAREIHRIAYDVAVAAGAVELATEAARFLGRVCRRQASWSEAVRWYESGLEVSVEVGLRRTEALILDGLGNTHRERGNLPGAREALEKALAIGKELEDREVLGAAHQDLMILEKHDSRTDAAIRHGWAAVEAHVSEEAKIDALMDLGSVFLSSRQIAAAEDAFSVVAARATRLDARALSLDALSHVSALRGLRSEFEERVRRVDEIPADRTSPGVRAQILLYRGRSFRALEDEDEARTWFRRAVAFAERNEINRVLFEAESELGALEGSDPDRSRSQKDDLPKPDASSLAGVREGLSRLREVPVGTPL